MASSLRACLTEWKGMSFAEIQNAGQRSGDEGIRGESDATFWMRCLKHPSGVEYTYTYKSGGKRRGWGNI